MSAIPVGGDIGLEVFEHIALTLKSSRPQIQLAPEALADEAFIAPLETLVSIAAASAAVIAVLWDIGMERMRTRNLGREIKKQLVNNINEFKAIGYTLHSLEFREGSSERGGYWELTLLDIVNKKSVEFVLGEGGRVRIMTNKNLPTYTASTNQSPKDDAS